LAHTHGPKSVFLDNTDHAEIDPTEQIPEGEWLGFPRIGFEPFLSWMLPETGI
jgi:hypothetical protein